MSAFLTTPCTADRTRQAARPRTPPHNRQTTARHRTPSSSASSLRSRGMHWCVVKTSKEVISSTPEPCYCVESARCTLFYLGRCVAGDDGLYTREAPILESTHTNTHTHTNTNKRTAQPVKVRGAGSRRIYTVKPCSLESLVKGGLLTPRGRATGPSRAN